MRNRLYGGVGGPGREARPTRFPTAPSSSRGWIPACAGMDSRLRGNDKVS